MSSADPNRNFTLSVEERIRALTIGVPAWAARKRKIEDDQERYVTLLVELHDDLLAKGKSFEQIHMEIVTSATRLDIDKHNELIDKHNRYYPIEANLAMSRDGNYLVYGRVWLPEEKITARMIVDRVRRFIDKRKLKKEEPESE